MSPTLFELLRRSSARHDHLCPRQVLGVRMGLAGLLVLGWPSSVSKDEGFIIIETDGCFADGMEIATGATVGHRTLRVNDLGKIAATFADLRTGAALRFAPRREVRLRACEYAPNESRRYYAQLEGYQHLPDEDLFQIQEDALDPPGLALASSPEARAICQRCGEEVGNQREVLVKGLVLCRQCAGAGYYVVESQAQEVYGVYHGNLD